MNRYMSTFAVVTLMVMESFNLSVDGFNGAAPSLASDKNNVYLVYALGDSILFSSSNNKGKDFSNPVIVTVLPQLSIGGNRGPKIATAKDNLVIAAADKTGNIYTFIKNKKEGQWKKGARINDVPDVAKEAFVSLAANEKGELYAVWLDLRNNNKNKIAGAKSINGGRTWLKNTIIYSSPDGTVCECCRPSVVMKNKTVAVMFRNWLNGNRDLFLIASVDGGMNFEKAHQLGEGKWKLNACPMDGGGLVIRNDNTILTVWRREGDIYTCEAGQKEKKIATGKQCTVAANNNSSFISYINNGSVYCIRPGGTVIELGTGSYPQVVMVNDETAVCTWQDNKEVKFVIVNK